jgi:hypothetical protein
VLSHTKTLSSFLFVVLAGGLASCTGAPTAGTHSAGTPAGGQVAGGSIDIAPGGTPGPIVKPTKIVITTTPYDISKIPDCMTPRLLALPLELTRFKTEAEMRAAVGPDMLFPDPSTMPSDAQWHEGYHNLHIVTDKSWVSAPFKGDTLGINYFLGDPKAAKTSKPRALGIVYYNQVRPWVEPKEAHKTITIRGGKTAYVFAPPFSPGTHSVQWKEDCRIMSVIGDLPEADVIKIAEGLKHGS